MGQGEDDKQADRPVRSSGEWEYPCDRCARTHGHDGYALPTTRVLDNDGDVRVVLCAQCLRDALANVQTEQRRLTMRTPESTSHASPLLSPNPSNAPNPRVGVSYPADPQPCTRCSKVTRPACWGRPVKSWRERRPFCSYVCRAADEVERR